MSTDVDAGDTQTLRRRQSSVERDVLADARASANIEREPGYSGGEVLLLVYTAIVATAAALFGLVNYWRCTTIDRHLAALPLGIQELLVEDELANQRVVNAALDAFRASQQ